MPVTAATRQDLPRFSRFGWLMGLYGENYQRLSRLFDLSSLQPGSYLSRCPDGLDLLVEVLEVHPYTHELRISYRMRDPLTGQPDPSAYVRVYRDAKQAEVTHCYVGRQWQDVLGLRPSPKILFGHRLRMNSFLNKWLDYLAGQGHTPQTLARQSSAATDEESVVCA
jgi:uncharacterized protein YqiB (DUF1249 family)